MCVETTFGILKDGWRLKMKQSSIHLKNILNIIGIYVVLFNSYIVNNEKVEEDQYIEP